MQDYTTLPDAQWLDIIAQAGQNYARICEREINETPMLVGAHATAFDSTNVGRAAARILRVAGDEHVIILSCPQYIALALLNGSRTPDRLATPSGCPDPGLTPEQLRAAAALYATDPASPLSSISAAVAAATQLPAST